MRDLPGLVFDTNTLISGLLLLDSLPARAVKKGIHEGKIIVSRHFGAHGAPYHDIDFP